MAPGGAGDGATGTAAARDEGSHAVLAVADGEALAGLEFHWGDAYAVSLGDAGTWRAARRDRAGAVLTADSAEELNKLIRADYAASPVPREFRAGDAK